jgi:hypothetical protein
VGSPEEGPAAPAADAAIVRPEGVLRGGHLAADGADPHVLHACSGTNVMIFKNIFTEKSDKNN